jgi:poly(A) polymerase/tRNA nucleotidyltransferase (CCA-adding enzyme)
VSLPDVLRAPAPQAVFHALPGTRAVGGCVRDALAGLPVQDLDMAAPFPPEEISERLKRAGFRIFETGLAHGTVTAVLHGTPIEVTSLRRDVSTDGRHAEVAWTTNWHEDAARRDFTINSMSMDADGALHDDHGGAADLHAGRVRFVGDPSTRLAEDYLRALRFFRFQARFGRGEPDPAAIAAIQAAVPGLARLSAERVWSELKRLLAAPDPRESLALMVAAGVLPAVLPEAGDPSRLRPVLDSRDPLLRLGALLPASTDLGALAQRLRLSGDEAARLRALHATDSVPAAVDADSLRRFAARTTARGAHATPGEIARVAAAESPDRDLAPLFDLPPGPAFPLLGRDALALGIAPGPRLGRLLDATREWWIEHGGNRDACLAHLRELAESGPR